MSSSSEANEKTLHELIGDVRIAMFTTRAADGRLRARPMTTQKRDDAHPDSLLFFMSRSSDSVRELQAAPDVNLGYADRDHDVWVSVAGRATLVDDRALRERLWSKMNEAWFPKGIDDPDLALVGVEVVEAEYWNVTDSKITQAGKMLKAAITGQRPKDMGEHGHVSR